MDGSAGRAMARLAGVAVLAMLVGALATVAAGVMLDRFAQPSVRLSPLPASTIVVAVEGAVATPGVHALPAGARLGDLVDVAGGLDADADPGALNLAARIGDGETVIIPDRSMATPESAQAEAESAGAGPVNVNTADAPQLETLPGIGPVLAERIIAEREQNGPFTTIDDLTRVDGISVTTIEELRPLVTVDG